MFNAADATSVSKTAVKGLFTPNECGNEWLKAIASNLLQFFKMGNYRNGRRRKNILKIREESLHFRFRFLTLLSFWQHLGHVCSKRLRHRDLCCFFLSALQNGKVAVQKLAVCDVPLTFAISQCEQTANIPLQCNIWEVRVSACTALKGNP